MRRVAAKFVHGDVGGAVRVLASAEGLAPYNSDTLAALREKHPPAPGDLALPSPPEDLGNPAISEEEVRRALNSFRPGSAGGPDGIRPGHLRSLTSLVAAEAGARLLTALTDLVNLVLGGRVPEFAVPTFFGATLCGLRKRGGGIRPVAVGCTFRRLATKIGARPLSSALGSELSPVQLGFGCQGGCEAAAHAARRYLQGCAGGRVLLKIDMRNAFNSLRRDSFLLAARERAGSMYSLLWQAYAAPSKLFFGEEELSSETGIQQGDPFGPALFALAVDDIARGVQAEFNVWYLDDATLGDTPERVLEDVGVLVRRLKEIGLEVNGDKCELTVLDQEGLDGVESSFRAVLPGVRVVQADRCTLLGAPLSEDGIARALGEKGEDLRRMVSRLDVLDNHQAFVLLRNAFSIPKLLYVLRASPAYLRPRELEDFDRVLREGVSGITNVDMTNEAWGQASLSVSLGGLGCRGAGEVALPAFVSSLGSTGSLVEAILSKPKLAESGELASAVEEWGRRCEDPVPTDFSQKSWDVPLMRAKREGLLREADQVARARLLAAAHKESGAWLNAIPVPSLGTQLDPEVFRVSCAIRIGARVCEPHTCRCGRGMDERGLHGLSCKYSAGRHPRHAALNDVVKRALQRAGLPSVLEPPGLDRGDGSRPDGITVFPFSRGRSLVWDCTCVDTFAETHLAKAATEAGSIANGAEDRKRSKYSGLSATYRFEPIAIETSGVYGGSTGRFVRELSRRLVETTGDTREASWFQQNLALAIQRGNAFSILSASRGRF